MYKVIPDEQPLIEQTLKDMVGVRLAYRQTDVLLHFDTLQSAA